MDEVPVGPQTAPAAVLFDHEPVAPPTNSTRPAELELDEGSAVARAQDGDLVAFEALVEKYQRPIFRLALRIVRNRAQAEDVVQETFIAAWRKLPTLQESAAFRGWLYQVATRRSLDVLRRARPQVPLDEESAAQSSLRPSVDDPERAVERRAELADLHRVLGELPAEQRACWTLKEFHDLSYGEIASALDLPVSTVRGRIARARATLAERMTPWR